MIYYLATKRAMYPIRTYLESTGKGLAREIIPLTYEGLFRRMTPEREFWWKMARESYWLWKVARQSWSPLKPKTLRAGETAVVRAYRQLATRRLAPGTYVFSDIERLSPEDAETAALAWQTLSSSGSEVRLLNHPTRSMRRYELLRNLYERGINRFNVYRPTEARWPQRYPVFLRRENDHGGWKSPLLRTREELEQALAVIEQEGKSRDGIIITEFCDTADEAGIYRKYGAFIVGNRIFPKSVQFSKHWVQNASDLDDEGMLREEREYLERNPHADELREVFKLARIDYGRMDYGLLDGKVQAWEINTNPMIASTARQGRGAREMVYQHVAREMASAFEEIATSRV